MKKCLKIVTLLMIINGTSCHGMALISRTAFEQVGPVILDKMVPVLFALKFIPFVAAGSLIAYVKINHYIHSQQMKEIKTHLSGLAKDVGVIKTEVQAIKEQLTTLQQTVEQNHGESQRSITELKNDLTERITALSNKLDGGLQELLKKLENSLTKEELEQVKVMMEEKNAKIDEMHEILKQIKAYLPQDVVVKKQKPNPPLNASQLLTFPLNKQRGVLGGKFPNEGAKN